MSRPDQQHLFVQWADKGHVHEAAWVDRAESPDRQSFTGPWLLRAGARARRVKRTVGEFLHAAAFGLYLTPALILGRLGPRIVGDICILGFAVLVIVFFALLNLYIVVALIEWRRSHRSAPLGFALPFTGRGGDALDLLDARDAGQVTIATGVDDAVAQPGDPIRVRGVATRLPSRRAEDGDLFDDRWFPQSRPHYRVTRGYDFVVGGADQIPVVVRVVSAPVVIARPVVEEGQGDPPPAIGELLAACGIDSRDVIGSRVVIADGDPVELVGVVDQVIGDVGTFELDGRMRSLTASDERGSPYRRRSQGAGLVVRCSPGQPCVVRKLQEDRAS